MAVGSGSPGSPDLLSVGLQGDTRQRVVWLDGELDMYTVQYLSDALAIALRGGPQLLLVDLRNLQFMDSTGLKSLIEAEGACRANGSRLVLVRGPRPVHRVFEISGLTGAFEFVTDPEEASSIPEVAGSVDSRASEHRASLTGPTDVADVHSSGGGLIGDRAGRTGFP